MSFDGSLAPRSGGGLARPAAAGPPQVPAGTGAVGSANLSMVRMTTLLEQALQALLILQDVGINLARETTVTGEMAERLTASFGERTSLEELRIIAAILTQVVEGSLHLVVRGHDAVRAALVANFQVLVAQEHLHALGADGAWVDSQRRAG